MIEIKEKSSCCGCSACAQICPKQCISMVKDKEGFLYPIVDESACVGCELCRKVCPQLAKQIPHTEILEEPKAYGGWHKDEEILSRSSSGGVFSLFADKVIAEGGAVYGCALNEDMKAVHVRVQDSDSLETLRGSKYVQSDIDGAYAQAWQDLRNGRMVLFTGTPCQIAGLRSYLEAKALSDEMWERLYMCDFICHGVPSPDVFSSYLRTMEQHYHDKIVSFRFRTKDRQWNPTGLQLGTGTGTGTGRYIRKCPGFKDAYMNGFLSDLYLRPSCHECHFKYIPKDYADFTIADFWGVNKTYPSLMNAKGTSLLLIHNCHGQELFEQVKEKFHYESVDFEKAISRNHPLLESAEKNPQREEFFESYAVMPFEKVERRYMKASDWFLHRLGGVAWKILEKLIRQVWGTILRILHSQWNETQWKNFFQFVRFCIIGVSNVLVSYSVNVTTLFLQRPLHFSFDYVIANCMAFLLSVLWSFHWNSRYTFDARPSGRREKFKMLLKMYSAYAFTGIVVNNLLGTFWIRVVGVSKFISPLLNIPFTFSINFLMNKFWTFGRCRRNQHLTP